MSPDGGLVVSPRVCDIYLWEMERRPKPGAAFDFTGRSLRDSGEHGATGDRPLSWWVHAEIHPLERTGAKKNGVARLSEDHIVRRLGSSRMDNRNPDLARPARR